MNRHILLSSRVVAQVNKHRHPLGHVFSRLALAARLRSKGLSLLNQHEQARKYEALASRFAFMSEGFKAD